MINRRAFFAKSAAGVGATAFLPNLGRSSEMQRGWPGQKPASIIHMVADGMSAGTFTCGDYLSRLVRNRGLTWTHLMNTPGAATAMMNMRSIDSMVTDSAAASSSWGSGSRVQNGSLNRLPSGKRLLPLYALFGESGWKRGLVTTTEITHATPAGFASCVESRDQAGEIANQYLERGIEVLLGGGRKFFENREGEGRKDLRASFAAAGYHVMDCAADLEAAPAQQRWLGTFSESHLPFTIDWLQSATLQQTVPSLSAMTSRALSWLGQYHQFIIQVEGGRVDHGAHNCDAAATLRDLIAFDEALEVVIEFQRKRPDTLVIITTDHGNGNMGMNGTGTRYSESSPMFARIADARASFPEILRLLRSPEAGTPARGHRATVPKPARVREVIAEMTGHKVPEKQAALFSSFLAKRWAGLYEGMNSETAQLGQLMANHTGVGWAGGSHTADFVPLTALGPGAERFNGFIQNTELFARYTEFANIDYKNPEEPLLALRNTTPDRAEKTAEYALA